MTTTSKKKVRKKFNKKWQSSRNVCFSGKVSQVLQKFKGFDRQDLIWTFPSDLSSEERQIIQRRATSLSLKTLVDNVGSIIVCKGGEAGNNQVLTSPLHDESGTTWPEVAAKAGKPLADAGPSPQVGELTNRDRLVPTSLVEGRCLGLQGSMVSPGSNIVEETGKVEFGDASERQPSTEVDRQYSTVASKEETVPKRLALLIDAENISPRNMDNLLPEVAKYGEVKMQRIFGDWGFDLLIMKRWRTKVTEHNLVPVHQYTFVKKKGSSDAALMIHCMDLLYRKGDDLDGFVIVSSDSDFTPLVLRLRKENKLVVGVGQRKSPWPYVSACDHFIYVETLFGLEAQLPCRFFVFGNCQMGMECKFSHDNKRKCYFFEIGRCKYGNSCIFSHDQTADKQLVQQSASVPGEALKADDAKNMEACQSASALSELRPAQQGTVFGEETAEVAAKTNKAHSFMPAILELGTAQQRAVLVGEETAEIVAAKTNPKKKLTPALLGLGTARQSTVFGEETAEVAAKAIETNRFTPALLELKPTQQSTVLREETAEVSAKTTETNSFTPALLELEPAQQIAVLGEETAEVSAKTIETNSFTLALLDLEPAQKNAVPGGAAEIAASEIEAPLSAPELLELEPAQRSAVPPGEAAEVNSAAPAFLDLDSAISSVRDNVIKLLWSQGSSIKLSNFGGLYRQRFREKFCRHVKTSLRLTGRNPPKTKFAKNLLRRYFADVVDVVDDDIGTDKRSIERTVILKWPREHNAPKCTREYKKKYKARAKACRDVVLQQPALQSQPMIRQNPSCQQSMVAVSGKTIKEMQQEPRILMMGQSNGSSIIMIQQMQIHQGTQAHKPHEQQVHESQGVPQQHNQQPAFQSHPLTLPGQQREGGQRQQRNERVVEIAMRMEDQRPKNPTPNLDSAKTVQLWGGWDDVF